MILWSMFRGSASLENTGNIVPLGMVYQSNLRSVLRVIVPGKNDDVVNNDCVSGYLFAWFISQTSFDVLSYFFASFLIRRRLVHQHARRLCLVRVLCDVLFNCCDVTSNTDRYDR